MKITTQSGKTFEAAWVLSTQTRMGVKQMAMQLDGETALEDIVSDLVGSKRMTSSEGEGAYTVYDGYTLLSSLTYSADRKTLRVVLERGDDA